LDQAKKIWEAFVNFLVTYDSRKIAEVIEKLKWEEVIVNPYAWLIGLPILGLMLMRKMFKTLILVFSLAAFVYLVQITFPPSAHTIPLGKLLRFIGGCVFLGLINLYFMFVRAD
jgi:hypothetical protein